MDCPTHLLPYPYGATRKPSYGHQEPVGTSWGLCLYSLVVACKYGIRPLSPLTITHLKETTMSNQNKDKNSQQSLFPRITNASQAIMYIEDYHSDEFFVESFQYLIDTGLVWQLQGWYGRTAMHMINAGICVREKKS